VEIKEKTGGFLAHHFPGVFQWKTGPKIQLKKNGNSRGDIFKNSHLNPPTNSLFPCFKIHLPKS
jgi:hypothetical protein